MILSIIILTWTLPAGIVYQICTNCVKPPPSNQTKNVQAETNIFIDLYMHAALICLKLFHIVFRSILATSVIVRLYPYRLVLLHYHFIPNNPAFSQGYFLQNRMKFPDVGFNKKGPVPNKLVQAPHWSRL